MTYSIYHIILAVLTVSGGTALLVWFLNHQLWGLCEYVWGWSLVISLVSGAFLALAALTGNMPWDEASQSEYDLLAKFAKPRHREIIASMMKDGLVSNDEYRRFQEIIRAESIRVRNRRARAKLDAIASGSDAAI